MRFIVNCISFMLIIFCITPGNSNACSGGSNVGTLTPTAAYQTQAVTNGQYYTVNVTCGDIYNFTFCSNGGTATWDTQITINQTDNTTELAYNDDACGLQSNVSWQATFTGTVHVLVSLYSCNNGGGNNATLAYNVTAGALSAAFSLSATSCSSASATITGNSGGTFSFNPATGDGATINASTGTISNGNGGTTYFVDYTICSSTTNESVTLPAGDAGFGFTQTCGGAAANVTGDVGGVFSWNPDPGDGAVLNTSSGTITNATQGQNYTVDYTVCGTTSTESVVGPDNDCWTLNGNAQYITIGAEQCIQLTDEVNNQTGCAWSGTQIDFDNNFSLSLDYYFGNNVNGADGNTFTFQPSSATACGGSGAQLGGGGIANSLVVEFDTYDNDGGSSWDLSSDHIAVEIDGDLIDDPSNFPANSAPYAGPVSAKAGGGNIDDGGTYQVEIAWDATAQQLDIFFDGDLRLSCTGDFVNSVFGGQNLVYWGATSATGGLNNQQYFCPSSVIVVLPLDLVSFYSECNNDDEFLRWQTASEEGTDIFQVEYTYDGFTYFPIGTIPAAGYSEELLEYRFKVSHSDNRQRYYRLKMIDIDGSFKTTDLISSGNCGKENLDLLSVVNFRNNQLEIVTNEDAEIAVINQLGQVILQDVQLKKEGKIHPGNIAKGVYYVRAIGRYSKRVEVKKIIYR